MAPPSASILILAMVGQLELEQSRVRKLNLKLSPNRNISIVRRMSIEAFAYS